MDTRDYGKSVTSYYCASTGRGKMNDVLNKQWQT